MNTNKLKTKDIITITLLTLINVVIFYATSMLYATALTVMLMPVVLALLNSIAFFMLGAKVKKKGALFIYCAILGILGTYLPWIIAYIISGLIAEVIMWKTGYGNLKGLLLSFTIIQLLASVASTFYPYMIAIASMIPADTSTLTEKELSVIEASEMLLSGGFIAVAIGVVAASLIGGFLASRIVKKHLVTLAPKKQIREAS